MLCNRGASGGVIERTPLRVAVAETEKESTRLGRLEIAELLREHRGTQATSHTKNFPTGPV